MKTDFVLHREQTRFLIQKKTVVNSLKLLVQVRNALAPKVMLPHHYN